MSTDYNINKNPNDYGAIYLYEENTSNNFALNTAYSTNEEWGCCNDMQTNFLLLYIAFICLGILFWKAPLLAPIQSMNRAIHSFCQGFMTWITGGDIVQVQEEQLDMNKILESHKHPRVVVGKPVPKHKVGNDPLILGIKTPKAVVEQLKKSFFVKKVRRGCRCLIVPAGYLGTASFAMVLLLAAGDRFVALITAGVLAAVLAFSLYFTDGEPTNVAATLAHTGALALTAWIDTAFYHPILQYLIQFYGVCSFVFILNQISADSEPQTQQQLRQSDTFACYNVCCICLPKCVALQWTLTVLLIMMLASWMALAELSDECQSASHTFYSCLVSNTDRVDAWDGVDFGGFWEQTVQRADRWTDTVVAWKKQYIDGYDEHQAGCQYCS